ncbi:hypothetical protein Taro_021251 [Colocasia esculenta]|uniref:Uncharacterized protein n=1 Tax=Colocasia esculenta TaxID=4460 RepID=A0A843V0U3_COLES|nr:hypothetical protein [Colocasia esculenta]
MEDAMAAEAPQQLTAVQRLQLLINELEEYEVFEPSDKPTLDQYIPWEEIERKRRLRNWLLHVQHEALQEGDLHPSPNLSLFNGDEEITMEQLDSMFSSFHCYMVFIPPPKELQTPTSNTTAQAGDKPTTLVYQRRPPGNSNRHPKKGSGRHPKAASSTTKQPHKVILFHGKEVKPLPEPQIRADSYIFDPSDEEGGLSDKVPQSGDKNSSPYASSNEPDNVPPLPNEKLLAPISQKKTVKSKEPSGSSSRESSYLDQIRSEADDKILQQLQSLPVNITVWEAIAWSKDLRETLIKILQEPENYEAHMANFQAQACEALAANVTFTDEDLLLSSPYHNRPLYMKGKINNMQLNRILVDPGASINLMPYKTFQSLYLMPYMQRVKDPLCLPSFGRSGPARAVSISNIKASLFGVFNFISGILILGRSRLAKLAFWPSNTLFSCGHPQLSRLLTLAYFSNLEVTGFSVALQSFNPPGPGRFNLTDVYPVPNISDKIHPTLLLDSHAKCRSGMLLQRPSNNFNGRRILKVERDWMVQDTDLERSWEDIAKNKIAPHHMRRLEGHK